METLDAKTAAMVDFISRRNPAWTREKCLQIASPGKQNALPAAVASPVAEPTSAVDPALCGWTAGRNGPLVDRYRPGRLAGVFGQPAAIKQLSAFAKSPYSTAYLFSGETGTGKTSAAMALATELGCAVEHGEMGGLWVVASGEQSADAVRDVCRTMRQRPFHGSGWQVIVVNEADRMTSAAETIWLDVLEALPPRVVVVFSTNNLDKLSQRFQDRCQPIQFASAATAGMIGEVRRLLGAVYAHATGRNPDADVIGRIANGAIVGGNVSFRRAVQLLQPALCA